MVKTIPFWKMSGSGNDFILVDNREGVVSPPDLPAFVRAVCRRKLSVGADGLILIESHPEADFKWVFFNADGSLPEMCGNGARCAARFAFLNGIAGPEMRFITAAGPVSAVVSGDRVRIRVPDPMDLRLDVSLPIAGAGVTTVDAVNTGVPHVVLRVPDVNAADVVGMGRKIRFHEAFAPIGTNVNFVSPAAGGIAIRTYERGVEDETLACGTGCLAVAILAAVREGIPSPVSLFTRSGMVNQAHFTRTGDRFTQVFLEGDARIVYAGELRPDAWDYPSPQVE